MSTPESTIQRAVMLRLANHGVTIWRQNVGLGWAGDAQRLESGAMLIRSPRPLRCGLCKGSSDLIGLRSIDITQEMVGRRVAQFVAVETKSKRGVVSDEQRNFTDFVRDAGGLGLIVRSVDDVDLPNGI